MLKERLRYPLYDTNTQSAGAVPAGTKWYFFTVGQGGGTKTDLDTNLTTNGQMPYDAMTVLGIRLYLYTRTNTVLSLADANQILNNSILIYKRQDREILKVPAHWIPAGIGFGANGSTTMAVNGTPNLANLYKVLPETYKRTDRLQLTIELINGITTAVDVSIEVMLEGIVDKGF